jgi:hypothetical protein
LRGIHFDSALSGEFAVSFADIAPKQGRTLLVTVLLLLLELALTKRNDFDSATEAMNSIRPFIFAVVLALGHFSSSGAAQRDYLVEGFLNPPAEARPWVYWFVMDGNLTREGITADFEAMQQAGIGGLIMMEVDAGIEKGPVKFMSDEWRRLFAHAVAEAQRLGLQMTLNAGPGWTGSGGPWVKPEESMQHLVASTTKVAGPTNFSAVLPRPKRRPAFFGDGNLPTEIERAKDEFYRDVAVLAFPDDGSTNRILDIDEKALYLRAPYSSQPGVRSFFASAAAFASGNREGVAIPKSAIKDITSFMNVEGRLEWTVPPGHWTILRFGRTSTGANTRPAPAPGLGLESDKFSATALASHFENFVGKLLKEVGTPNKNGAGWTSLHIDSWEMGSQNWTRTFRKEFRGRRGYDPLFYYPVITGLAVGDAEISDRFLWDLRQTAQELVLENHAQHLKKLGKKHGLGLSIEPYDMNPCADMSLGAVADVPMCEFWLYGFNTFYSVIEATSIAHTCGRPIVAAESFTSSDAERWQAFPGSMKTLGDWAFSAGVNRIVFHRYQHQPWLDRVPGMTMGPYGVHWERTQTWWNMSSAYHNYLARSQFLLRQGLMVADVCCLAGEGSPHVFHPPQDALAGVPPDRLGYSVDGCAPESLLSRAQAKHGRIVFPDGMSYRLLLLPSSITMTPQLLQKVHRLVKGGVTVIGPRPEKSPSLSGFPECDQEVARLSSDLWGKVVMPKGDRRFGRGRVVWDMDATRPAGSPEHQEYGDFALVRRVLQGMEVPPDFESKPFLRYIHRSVGETDLYFVANPEDKAIQAQCQFRVSGKQPELWDAVNGERRYLPEFSIHEGRTSVPIAFAPHQSFFVVFRRPVQTSMSKASNNLQAQMLLQLPGPWTVSFESRGGAPTKVVFDELQDWSKHSDPAVKYFSGQATYRQFFNLRSGLPAGNSRVELDLGTVKNLARVRLNGVDLGVLWCAPWRMDLTRALKPGENELEITVANLWPNRLIGDSGLPSEKRSTWTTWNPYTPDNALLESGLLGPVRLFCSERSETAKAPIQ